MNIAIIFAGGSGVRMGAGIPKQFLEIGGKPILRHTIERFQAFDPKTEIILVLPDAQKDWWRNYCRTTGFLERYTMVSGGITRFHSVQNALAYVKDEGVVAIHDGVRPLVSADLVRRMLERMQRGECRALLPVVPVVDTLRSTDPATPDPDRSKVVAVQTPQIFRSEDIKAAYTQAYDLSFTDDASVAARKEIPLAFEAGERFNLKITTPEDLILAEALCSCNP